MRSLPYLISWVAGAICVLAIPSGKGLLLGIYVFFILSILLSRVMGDRDHG